MLTLRTFGALQVCGVDGAPIDAAGAQRRVLAVLSVLAVAGNSGASRERLVGLLWPEGDPEKTRHALTQTLYHARKTLDCDDLFILAGPQIRLNPERIGSDVAEFAISLETSDERAAELYRGQFLEGFFLPGVVEFDHWMSVQRSRFAADAGRAFERLAARAETSQDLTRTIEWRKRHVTLDPLNSSATLRLMTAIVAAGDPAGALQVARVHSLLLRSELEIDPDPAVVRLTQQLRTTPQRPLAAVGDVDPLPEREASASSAVDRRSPSELPWMPQARSRWWGVGRRAMVALAGVMGVAVIGVLIARREHMPPSTPATRTHQQVIVAPFRVSGADATLSYLSDGMVELLSTRLADDSVARSIDPGAVLSAWRAAAAPVADLSGTAAVDVGRRLKASHVVVGSVVGDNAHLIITASLIEVSSNETQAKVAVQGPTDSITSLVDRLAVRLLASNAGEGDRLSDRTTPSIPALRAFLDGQSAYRRGAYTEAVPLYERALERDSTFALAALYLALSTDRLNDAEQHDRALAIVWAHRADLSARDAAHLIAFAGPRYPSPSSESEILAAWEHAVALAPDGADVWYELAERYFRSGAVVGVVDTHQRAMAALSRVLELEPAHVGARRLLIMLLARSKDTARLTRVASPRALRDSMGGLGAFFEWRVALARDDERELTRVRARLSQAEDESLRAMAMASLNDAVGIDDGERAARIRSRRAKLAATQIDALLAEHSFALNEGRPSLAFRITEQMEQRQPGSGAHLRLRILDALYSDGDSAAAKAAAGALAVSTRDRATGDHQSRDAKAVRFANLCVLEQWRIAHGATSTAPAVVAALRASELSREVIPLAANPLACSAIVDASWAVATRQRDALGRVIALDSLMLSGPAVSDAATYAHIVVGRLYARLGQRAAALAAYRRRTYMAGWPRYLATARREEADLASLLGETAIAAASYRRYYALRRNAEPRVASSLAAAAHAVDAPRPDTCVGQTRPCLTGDAVTDPTQMRGRRSKRARVAAPKRQ